MNRTLSINWDTGERIRIAKPEDTENILEYSKIDLNDKAVFKEITDYACKYYKHLRIKRKEVSTPDKKRVINNMSIFLGCPYNIKDNIEKGNVIVQGLYTYSRQDSCHLNDIHKICFSDKKVYIKNEEYDALYISYGNEIKESEFNWLSEEEHYQRDIFVSILMKSLAWNKISYKPSYRKKTGNLFLTLRDRIKVKFTVTETTSEKRIYRTYEAKTREAAISMMKKERKKEIENGLKEDLKREYDA